MLNTQEKNIAEQMQKLKDASGSHSPSIYSMATRIPDLNIKIDACFLSNPYATELFLEYLQKELIQTGKLKDILEYYPTQNRELASVLSPTLEVAPESIMVGNGGCEIIQALFHRFAKKKVLIILPTFSPYYEFARPDTEVIFHTLDKNEDFKLNIDAWVRKVQTEKPDTVVIINPNNPDAGYIPVATLKETFSKIRDVEQIILDESFVHFSFEEPSYPLISNLSLIQEFPNLVTIKSMSKDFGIAGIRAGYAIMAPSKVDELLRMAIYGMCPV